LTVVVVVGAVVVVVGAVVVVVGAAVVVVVGAVVVVGLGASVVGVVGAVVVVVGASVVLVVVTGGGGLVVVVVVLVVVVVVTGGMQSPAKMTEAVFVALTPSGQVPCTLKVTVPVCVPGRVVVAVRLTPPPYSPSSPVTVPDVTVTTSTVIFWVLSEFFTVHVMTYWPETHAFVPDTTG
jgi:hypothetical protein